MRFTLVVHKNDSTEFGIKDTQTNLVAVGFGSRISTMYYLKRREDRPYFINEVSWEDESMTDYYIDYTPKQKNKEYVHGM